MEVAPEESGAEQLRLGTESCSREYECWCVFTTYFVSFVGYLRLEADVEIMARDETVT